MTRAEGAAERRQKLIDELGVEGMKRYYGNLSKGHKYPASPFKDSNKAREAQKKSVESRKRNKDANQTLPKG